MRSIDLTEIRSAITAAIIDALPLTVFLLLTTIITMYGKC